MHTQQNKLKCTIEHACTNKCILKDTYCTVQAGKMSEEMLMPTNKLRRAALKWSLSQAKAKIMSLGGRIKAFRKCCLAEAAS